VPPFKVDLTNCDREPIHTPGSIQPHGAMLICEQASGIISHASANAASFLAAGERPLIGRALGDAIGETAAHDLRNAAAKAGGPQTAGALRAHTLPGIAEPFDITIHHHEGLLFVELEVSTPTMQPAEDPLDMTQAAVRRIGMESNANAIAATAARLVRAMLGYDRVMVYRFLHNGAGQVIAEARRSDSHSFMGQFFPASDIPMQARRLYLLNWIRMIADVGYTPVPLLPASCEDVSPIDMSHAHLRSVSPIHCEYLTNIGVAASLSISIVVDDTLWGLIACHHDTPKIVALPQRLGAELFGQYFSLQVAAAERREALIASRTARARLDAIVTALTPDEPVGEILISRLDEFAALIPCDGTALWIDGAWKSTGVTPPDDGIHALMALVAEQAADSVWSTHELRLHLQNENGYGGAVAGLLAIPISSLGRDYLLFFRSEEAHNIEWAGEPKKTIVSSPLGDRLTPRGSFETWREEVKGQSKPWTDADCAVADSIRTYLRDVVLRYSEATAEERARQDKWRRMLNDELNHRVKNIIALVKSIALQTGASARTVEDYSRALEGRLRALAFAHDQSLSGQGGDLLALMEAEASLHRYGANPDRVVVSGPPLGLKDRAFGVVALLTHEMMTNAAKYGSLSVPQGRLDIEWSLTADGDCAILWQESGGPTVETPTSTGFGSKLIRSSIEYDLGGDVAIAYPASGLVGRFRIPARHLLASVATRTAPNAPAAARRDVLSGLRILLIEDQALIAMDTEAALLALRAAGVQSVPSVSEARKVLRQSKPDLAVLDFNLDGENSAVIADDLTAAGIPFVFATGYGDSETIPPHFSTVPLVQKPISIVDLASKLQQALASRDPRPD
jgi:light-regulated signal transduction histidine kinase (bacteriophytochrome)